MYVWCLQKCGVFMINIRRINPEKLKTMAENARKVRATAPRAVNQTRVVSPPVQRPDIETKIRNLQLLQRQLPLEDAEKIINEYLEELITTENVNPVLIDDLLTSLTRNVRGSVKEEIFSSVGSITAGRKKFYTLPNGKTYFLEVHNNKGKNFLTTRVCKNYDKSNRELREYLCEDGKFRTNSFNEGSAHLNTTKNGDMWLNPSANVPGQNLNVVV